MSSTIKAAKEQIQTFVQNYIEQIKEMTKRYQSPERTLLFPEYLSYCFHVKVIISETCGVAIEFINRTGDWESNNWKIEIEETEERIENAVLPIISDSGSGFFEVRGRDVVIENINLITDDFYAKYKSIMDSLSKASNFTMANAGWFIKVKDNSDVKLVDVGIACIADKREVIRKIIFLWIIGTNSPEFFTRDKAKEHAFNDVGRYLSRLLPKIPIPLLINTLRHYMQIIHKKGVEEKELQGFLGQNPFLLELTVTQTEQKPRISVEHTPDFLIETSLGEYIVIELENPQAKIFNRDLSETRELRKARKQIEEYLTFIRNNILSLRQKYPKLSVEKIKGRIIIGLSSRMNEEEIERLGRLNYDLKGYQIFTYDQLAQEIATFLMNLGVRFGPFNP